MAIAASGASSLFKPMAKPRPRRVAAREVGEACRVVAGKLDVLPRNFGSKWSSCGSRYSCQLLFEGLLKVLQQ